jgi:hypothetical protein
MPSLLFIPGQFSQYGVDGSALHAAADAENAEGSQRRPEGAEKRKELLSLFYSLC